MAEVGIYFLRNGSLDRDVYKYLKSKTDYRELQGEKWTKEMTEREIKRFSSRLWGHPSIQLIV